MHVTNDTATFPLPNLPEYDVWSPNDTSSTNNYIPVSPSANFKKEARNANMTTIFLPPSPEMTSVTAGVLILGPRNKTGVRLALVCSVDARWNKALHTMVESDNTAIGSPGNAISAKLNGRHSQSDLKQYTLPIPSDSWRQIKADIDGLDAALGYNALFGPGYQPSKINKHLRPVYTTALGAVILGRVTTIDEVGTSMDYWSDHTNAIESVIYTVFADVLSRIGIDRVLSSDRVIPSESVKRCMKISNAKSFCPPPSAAEASDWTRMEFQATRTGRYLLKVYESLSLTLPP